MKRFFVLTILSLLISAGLHAQEEKQIVVPYTIADRDRAIRNEVRLEAIDAKLDIKVDGLNNRIDNIQEQIRQLNDKFDSYFMWGFGLVLMAIFGLIGFVIYDRRTTLAPVESKTERIIKTLKAAAEKDPALREALKKTALW